MRKEITFTSTDSGLMPVAVYYDSDNNEFDRVVLNLNDAYGQITREDVTEFIEIAKSNIVADLDRLFSSNYEAVENTHNAFLRHTNTHQSLQLIKDYISQNEG